MNKYVLIPHEQYQSFKSFLADKKEHKIAESNQETVNDRDIHPKIHDSNSEILKGEEFRSVDSRILNNNNNNNNKRKSEKLLDNNRKETVSSEFSDNTKDKAEINHPLPPPGLPEKAVYNQDNYLSKIKEKNGREIQKGGGANEWIQKWTKKI